MTRLTAQVVRQEHLSEKEKQNMFSLMNLFYDNMTEENFYQDLTQKDYCIVLYDEKGEIKGFSTQQILEIPVEDKTIFGVFSGDTIIHKENWGSLCLFTAFAQFFFDYGEKYPNFYWFLISKGYKTYCLLPTFFREFYPTYRQETPLEMKKIIDGFGSIQYPDLYCPKTGVIHYKKKKDTLKQGVADITKSRRKNRDVAFFLEKNPGYVFGEDIVCITRLDRKNLNPHAEEILFR